MQEESIEEAKDIVITGLNLSKMEKLDRYELILNMTYFLTHYEEQTGIKVLKKEKKCSG